MKNLKLLVLLFVAVCTFGTAEAQQVIVNVGRGPYFYRGRHYTHRAPYFKHHHRYYRYY